jgi:hypothetical protein
MMIIPLPYFCTNSYMHLFVLQFHTTTSITISKLLEQQPTTLHYENLGTSSQIVIYLSY